jgi:hypothetical protein
MFVLPVDVFLGRMTLPLQLVVIAGVFYFLLFYSVTVWTWFARPNVFAMPRIFWQVYILQSLSPPSRGGLSGALGRTLCGASYDKCRDIFCNNAVRVYVFSYKKRGVAIATPL